MTTNKQLLKIAQKYLGQGGARFRKFAGLDNGQPWCNAYVDYIAHEGGVAYLYFDGKRETYCPHSMAWCKKNLAQVPLFLALPMDVIYFDWERNGIPNHIGFVRERKSTSEIRTIEGNTSGGIVAQKTRPSMYVQAIYRPHFRGEYKLGQLNTDSAAFSYSAIANLQKALGVEIDGVLGKKTVKALQKASGCKRKDGAWGPSTSKAVQRMTGAKPIDGDFGPASIRALKRWINKKNQETTEPGTPGETTAEKYPGTFPELPPKTAKIAVRCAYPYGTPLRKYSYKNGKAKPEYKEALNKAYPHRKTWKYAKSRAGASCDVFAGTVLKRAGYKDAPHAMSKMVAWCRENLAKVSSPQNGDILTRTNHVMVVVDLKGKKRVANAHFLDHGGTYGIIENPGKYTNVWRPRGRSYFSIGDTFTEMKKLKAFLNWYGNYNLHGYTFGAKTENAIKDFQKKEGLEPTGRFTETDLAKAKAVRK